MALANITYDRDGKQSRDPSDGRTVTEPTYNDVNIYISEHFRKLSQAVTLNDVKTSVLLFFGGRGNLSNETLKDIVTNYFSI